MGIRVEYTVHPIPDTYVTQEKIYKYINDPDEVVEAGKRPKKIRVEEVIEHRGGILIKFMRGHSIRLYDESHLAAFNKAMMGHGDAESGKFQLSNQPRLVDEMSGQVVNRNGIPIDIEHLVQTGAMVDGGAADEGGLFDGDGSDPIEAAINATA